MKRRATTSRYDTEPQPCAEGDTRASELHPDHNDDKFFASATYAGVFDGVGGKKGSEQAAQFTNDYCRDALEQLPYEISPADAELALKMVLVNAQEALHRTFNGFDITTTAAITLQHKDPTSGRTYLQIAHAGDSRVYAIRNGQLHFVTLDHAASTERLPEEEQRIIQDEIAHSNFEHEINSNYRTHLHARNVISSALSSEKRHTLKISLDSIELFPSDLLLLTSDGIHDNLTDGEIIQCAAAVDPVQSLIQYALRRSNEPEHVTVPADFGGTREATNFRSKYDDMTAVAIHVIL